MPFVSEHSTRTSGAGPDLELVRQVLKGGQPGERAGLELLLSQHPERYEDAVALLDAVGVASRRALDALTEAWHTYRRIEPVDGASA
jgi:hypothetical protein